MAIEQGIWKIGDKPEKLRPSGLADESLLEEQVMHDIAILDADWLLIGRQVRTDFDKFIDLLALDGDGNVIIIELKRNKTPREVVAQAIDYASWVVDLDASQIGEIYRAFAERYGRAHDSLEAAFEHRFGVPLDSTDIQLNNAHQLVVVATKLDASTERIINYLNDHADIAINALFFAAFEDAGNHYLSRAWMIDPEDSQKRVISRTSKQPWNGEFYVSFDRDMPWEDARRLGFIAGGGALWYSRTLDLLSEGDRVWVNIPGTGYVGVGHVTGERCRADQYEFDTADGPRTLDQMELSETYSDLDANADDEHAEYVVPVAWEKTVDRAHAVSESGLFGNQNTVCKPKTPKWDHTVKRLKHAWHIS
ncbi:hypothetical protein [Salinisphaera sp. LB1]|uniref:hypothetical protein n=1 Tax=Salinisphaera sp. LB1 TaxID=2183911 RepID=UPI000D706B76|nr:hypothetical protein [Salinisphaera sp. LB1]AWN15327.1 hypothetical protein SALB1_1120 [Salinisphaera sp. LB1]